MSRPVVDGSAPGERPGSGARQPASPGHDVPPTGTVRIDYHVHTRWSDDSETGLEELVARARQAGLSRICITDHDTLEGAFALQRSAPPDLEVIVGCEFSTDDGSQVIGLGLTEMIHEKRTLELMHAIRKVGGHVLIPHPFRRGSGIFRPEVRRSEGFVDHALSLIDLIECFNGRDTFDNNERNLRFADEHGLPSVAGSDAHTPMEVGSVFVEYRVPREVADGRSERWIYFPDRPQRRELVLKRHAMEFYHRNARRLPGPVNNAYRIARERLTRAPLPGVPHVQHRLPDMTAGPQDD